MINTKTNHSFLFCWRQLLKSISNIHMLILPGYLRNLQHLTNLMAFFWDDSIQKTICFLLLNQFWCICVASILGT